MTTTKKILFFFLVFIILFGSAELVFGQPSVVRNLEIKYPEVTGEQPEKVITPVPEYVRYIYNALIWLSGLIALIVLVIGGFEWFTSAGNIDRIRNAKNRISAAILGIIILIGSYLVLISINPELVVFHLPRLRPIISELTPGVLVCIKEVKEVDRAWQLTNNFRQAQEYWEQKQIADELKQVLKNINEKCYSVISSGDIRSDFDNKITDIYFIPGERTIDGKIYTALYGAILYEKRDFLGYTLACYDHFKSSSEVYTPEHRNLTQGNFKISEPSSIQTFTLNWVRNPSWSVWLFQKPNLNQGTNLTGMKYYIDPEKTETWYAWTYFDNLIDETGNKKSPESIWVEGDILGILFTDDGRGKSFSGGRGYNLLDEENLIDWEWCADYERGFRCAVAKSTKLLIINAVL